MVAGRNREVGVALTPAGQGRFEVYLNGEQIYNRKQPPSEVTDAVGDIRGGVSIAEHLRTKVLAALERANEAAAAAPPAH